MKPFISYSPLLLAALMVVALCPTPGQASNLKTDVISALQRNFLQPFQVTIKSPGYVQIKGTVPYYSDKLEIYKDVGKVPGVKKISELIEVRSHMLPDDVIRANIADELALGLKLPHPDKIHVTVDNGGTVILQGSVATPREADKAVAIAGWIPGVRSIANELQPAYASNSPKTRNSVHASHPNT